MVQNRLENGHGQNVRAHASWVPSWLNQPTRNLARTQHKQMGPSVTHASLTRLCRRVAHMQVLGLTPNCLPIPKLSRTPNGKTIVGVSRETHNALTHSLTLLVSHISLSLSLFQTLLMFHTPSLSLSSSSLLFFLRSLSPSTRHISIADLKRLSQRGCVRHAYGRCEWSTQKCRKSKASLECTSQSW